MVRPDEVWVGDITYVLMGSGFVYLAVLIGVFTRSIRGWALSESLEGAMTPEALKMALRRGRPEIHHFEKGLEVVVREMIFSLRSTGSCPPRPRRITTKDLFARTVLFFWLIAGVIATFAACGV